MGSILGGFAVGALAGTLIYFIGCVVWTLFRSWRNKKQLKENQKESDVIDINE